MSVGGEKNFLLSSAESPASLSLSSRVCAAYTQPPPQMSFFQKSLIDLVRGIRNAGNDSSVYTAKAIQEIKEEHKLRRLGRPSEIASVATFLVSSDASFVTGQVISVNSGISAG